MIIQRIKISGVFPKIPDKNATITTYITEYNEQLPHDNLPAMVIFPGGGYSFISERESEPIAIAFANLGFQCFVVNYSVSPHRFPQALIEGAGAVTLIRRRAAEWHIDPNKISVIGFSAGGHLAGCVGTLWNERFVCDALDITGSENRPDAMVLCYPVITGGEMAHRDSFENLLGEKKNSELIYKLSLENAVSQSTPPTFLWHTVNDNVVPSENSLMMAAALKNANVKFELHLYNEGYHGLSLASPRTEVPSCDGYVNNHISSWLGLCNDWLAEIWS